METDTELMAEDKEEYVALVRGHECWFDRSWGWWRWSDTNELMGDPNWEWEPWAVEGATVGGTLVQFPSPYPPYRGCIECGLLPTPEGHDGCLGTLPGIVSACCGHGERQSAYQFTQADIERRVAQLEAGSPLD